MAVTSVDTALAGMQPLRQWYKTAPAAAVANRPISFWPIAGCPGAGTYNAGLNGGTYSSSTSVPSGAIFHADPASGNSYLSEFLAQAPQFGVFLLCDRLWDNTLTMNVTTAQAITTPTWPARDLAGGTSGLGVWIGIETSAATSATAAAIGSYTYTNSAGGSKTFGVSVPVDVPTAVVSQPGYFYMLRGVGGDLGVQSVQSITFSTAWTSGQVNMVAFTVLEAIEVVGSWVPNRDDVLACGMPQLYNGVCPFVIFLPNTTTVGIFSGGYRETQG